MIQKNCIFLKKLWQKKGKLLIIKKKILNFSVEKFALTTSSEPIIISF